MESPRQLGDQTDGRETAHQSAPLKVYLLSHCCSIDYLPYSEPVGELTNVVSVQSAEETQHEKQLFSQNNV